MLDPGPRKRFLVIAAHLMPFRGVVLRRAAGKLSEG
jgi:hypothetical protein